MMLFQDPTSTINIIQTLGFPIVAVLGLSLFAYKVWQYQIRKLDEKDNLIHEQTIHSQSFSDKLLDTQNDMLRNFENQTELIKEIKEILHTNDFRKIVKEGK